MNPFTATHQELADDFRRRGIPTDAPGFCDHPSFLQAERNDPNYLNHYAAFISKKTYDEAYLTRARLITNAAATLLHAELVANGRLGACVDISGILFRILEEEGIWACCIKGSLTVSFPQGSGIGNKYFWSVDEGEFAAGHAWVFAPPYTVVDISVRQQPYSQNEVTYIPELILTSERRPATVTIDDIASPEIRAALRAHKIPSALQLKYVVESIPDIFKDIPAIEVDGLNNAKLKYSPVAIGGPQEKLAGITNMQFQGLTPMQLYESKLASKIAAMAGQ